MKNKDIQSVSAYLADHTRIKEIKDEQKLATMHDTVAFLVKQYDQSHGKFS